MNNPIDEHEPEVGFWRRHGWWLIPLLVIDLVILVWWLMPRDERGELPPEPVMAPVAQAAAEVSGLVIGYPTLQDKLLDTNALGVFMPTASGRPESALYGSTRTNEKGLPSFHEGVDIAPLSRDAKQLPIDRVFSIADGRIGYLSKSPGHSNYGRYVVVLHNDPAGEIYSLYAHLEEVSKDLKVGQTVKRGDDLGRMGHSPSHITPVERSHLHLEVGVVLNKRFHDWHNRKKLKPDHGNYHGHNLIGVDPLDVYREQEKNGRFSMVEYLHGVEPAITLMLKATRIPDYFIRYPALWSGDAPGGAIVITVSGGGIPLSGRPATEAEKEALGKKHHAVLSANPEALGRNGLRLVIPKGGTWSIGKNGETWIEILLHQ